MELFILIIYGIALLFVVIYSFVQLNLIFNYKKYQRSIAKVSSLKGGWPKVSVQLPIYNERYVAERLILRICELDYPKELLQIQVLDDSTDDTKAICQELVAEKKSEGFNISCINRKDRKGFKAGALAYGLNSVEGEFVAIFDADFMPDKNFLRECLPYLEDPEIGMVQTKWSHLNKNYSWLTRLQAFGLDAHFSIEQGGRNIANHFMNFNGTAGVWRKTTILDAGGWQSDTLTEDLDLSYRAQLKGWKFKFVENIHAPAELPAEINALKTQQFRWNKGAAECSRKNLGKVLRKKELGFLTKLNAIFHLLNSGIFLCILILAILSVPILFIKFKFPEYQLLFVLASSALISIPILAFFYYTSEKSLNENERSKGFFVLNFLAFLSVSMGMSLHNAIAVFEGYIGKKSPFIRTPKFNIREQKTTDWRKNTYLKGKLNYLSIIEFLLALYFLYGMLVGIQLSDYGLFPFHLMLFLGFLYVSTYSVFHTFSLTKNGLSTP